MKRITFVAIFAIAFGFSLQAQDRWKLEPDGSISWLEKKGEAHTDNIEMSGRFISTIITYGVDEKSNLIIGRRLVFPMLRTIPNDTHASLIYSFGQEASPVIRINNRQANEIVKSFSIRGMLTIRSTINNNILVTRQLLPSIDKPLMIEKCVVHNKSGKDITVDVEEFEKNTRTHKEKSVYGIYEISANIIGSGIYVVKPENSIAFSMVFSGRRVTEQKPVPDIDNEIVQRTAFVNEMFGNLQFISPDSVLNRMFDFAKIRAMESIFETKGGLVHSPGGASYYAAIWANDQAEYANPFFAYTGYSTAIEAGMVS